MGATLGILHLRKIFKPFLEKTVRDPQQCGIGLVTSSPFLFVWPEALQTMARVLATVDWESGVKVGGFQCGLPLWPEFI